MSFCHPPPRFTVDQTEVGGATTADLRAAPAATVEVVAPLNASTILMVAGPTQEGRGTRWWPVRVVGTDVHGYVTDAALTP